MEEVGTFPGPLGWRRPEPPEGLSDALAGLHEGRQLALIVSGLGRCHGGRLLGLLQRLLSRLQLLTHPLAHQVICMQYYPLTVKVVYMQQQTTGVTLP